MNKLFNTRIFSRSLALLCPKNPRKVGFLFSLGTFMGLQYYYKFHTVKMDKAVVNNELIFLSKNDYFDRILGNEKDFFFLIVYQDGKETQDQATQAAKQLKSIADENGFKNWNVYVINRSLLTDIKKIIGRTKEINLFEGETNYPIEIYMKSPHSRDFLYMHFKPKKFFSERGARKTLQKMTKIKNLIETVNDEEDLKQRLVNSSNKFNKVTVLMAIDETNKAGYKKVLKKYGKLSFLCLERKFSSKDSDFLLIGKKLAEKLGLEKNCPYILKNDAVTAYERFAGTHIDDQKDCIELDTDNFSIGKVYLKKYDNSEIKIFNTEKNKLPEEEKKAQKTKEIRSYINFMLPRIVILRDLKYRNMGQIMRKCSDDKSKLILSLYCPNNDEFRDKKLAIFMDIYKKYSDKFVFCIFESEIPEDLFPHCKSTYPSFVAFNFLKQQKDYGAFNKYYKNLVYSYEKFFLNPESAHDPNPEEIMNNIEKVLAGKAKIDYLSALEGNVQELRGVMQEEFLKKFQEEKKDSIILFHDDKVDSRNSQDLFYKLSEEFNDINFYKINNKNTSSVFPGFDQYPVILYLSHSDKKWYLLRDHAWEEQVVRKLISSLHS